MSIQSKTLSLLHAIKKLITREKDFIKYFNENYPITKPPKNAAWDKLLQKYVSENGQVDYKNLLSEKSKLENYISHLAQNPPNKNNWSKEDQLAYWINLYNAATVKLILDNYPVKSIRDIKTGLQIPFFNSPFDIRFIEVGDLVLSLNNVEHSVLRLYDEPRIHFAINCASGSCPVLNNGAYEATQLEDQLMKSTTNFLSDEKKNQLNKEAPKLSSIFQWYIDDFGGKEGLKEKLKSWTGKDLPGVNFEYQHYDWNLNEKEMGNAEETKAKIKNEK